MEIQTGLARQTWSQQCWHGRRRDGNKRRLRLDTKIRKIPLWHMKMATRANLPGKVHPPIRFADICPHSWSQDELEPIPSRPIGVKDGPDLLFFASTCLFTSFLFFLLNFSHLLFPSFLFELSTSFLPYLISLLTFLPSFLPSFNTSFLHTFYLFFLFFFKSLPSSFAQSYFSAFLPSVPVQR